MTDQAPMDTSFRAMPGQGVPGGGGGRVLPPVRSSVASTAAIGAIVQRKAVTEAAAKAGVALPPPLPVQPAYEAPEPAQDYGGAGPPAGRVLPPVRSQGLSEGVNAAPAVNGPQTASLGALAHVGARSIALQKGESVAPVGKALPTKGRMSLAEAAGIRGVQLGRGESGASVMAKMGATGEGAWDPNEVLRRTAPLTEEAVTIKKQSPNMAAVALGGMYRSAPT